MHSRPESAPQAPTVNDFFWGIGGAALVAGVGACIWITKTAWIPSYYGSPIDFDRVYGDDVRFLAATFFGLALSLHANFIWRRHPQTWRIGVAMLIAGWIVAASTFITFALWQYVF